MNLQSSDGASAVVSVNSFCGDWIISFESFTQFIGGKRFKLVAKFDWRGRFSKDAFQQRADIEIRSAHDDRCGAPRLRCGDRRFRMLKPVMDREAFL